jgi:succinate dehydrogenase/fumarate reductase flavoprotein subunit
MKRHNSTIRRGIFMYETNKWTGETDVVVVGYGGAGAVAAIAAHDAGAKVIILEKQPEDTATEAKHTPNTRMCGGAFCGTTDKEKAILYLQGMATIANETVDAERKELIEIFAQYMVDNGSWLRSIGFKSGDPDQFLPIIKGALIDNPQFSPDGALCISDFPEIPGADSSCVYIPGPLDGYTHGAALLKSLSVAIEKRGIEVLWESPGEHLVMEEGQVRGVTGHCEGKPFAIRARKGVVLTSGGFEFNEWMKENYLRVSPAYFIGNPANTGDGINMAIEAGAALWHMNCASWRAVMKFPDFPIAFATAHHEMASIFVDKTGNRFANERYRMHAFGYQLTNYDDDLYFPRVPCYWIFDENRRKDGPLASSHGACAKLKGVPGSSYYTWSPDNTVEINKGWIMKADTLDELANKIRDDVENNGKMSLSALENSVKRYNRFCREGKDTDFHRPAWSLTPIENPPYYAVKLWPGGPNTQGGPRRNRHAQVIRPDDTPVPRLYAAGELGSVWGMLYQGGGNIAECIAFGRIAGANAAAEKTC